MVACYHVAEHSAIVDGNTDAEGITVCVYCRVRSGLSPPSCCPCRVDQKTVMQLPFTDCTTVFNFQRFFWGAVAAMAFEMSHSLNPTRAEPHAGKQMYTCTVFYTHFRFISCSAIKENRIAPCGMAVFIHAGNAHIGLFSRQAVGCLRQRSARSGKKGFSSGGIRYKVDLPAIRAGHIHAIAIHAKVMDHGAA